MSNLFYKEKVDTINFLPKDILLYHGSGGMINNNVEYPLGSVYYHYGSLNTIIPSYYSGLDVAKVYSNSKTEYRNICSDKCIYIYKLKEPTSFILLNVYNILVLYKILLNEKNRVLLDDIEYGYGIYDTIKEKEIDLDIFFTMKEGKEILRYKKWDESRYKITRESSYEGDARFASWLCIHYGSIYAGLYAPRLLNKAEKGYPIDKTSTFHSEFLLCNPKKYLSRDKTNPADWQYHKEPSPSLLSSFLKELKQITPNKTYMGNFYDVTIWKLFHVEYIINKYPYFNLLYSLVPMNIKRIISFLSLLTYLPLLFNKKIRNYANTIDLSNSDSISSITELMNLSSNFYASTPSIPFLESLAIEMEVMDDINVLLNKNNTFTSLLSIFQRIESEWISFFFNTSKENNLWSILSDKIKEYNEPDNIYSIYHLLIPFFLSIGHVFSIQSIYGKNKLRYAEEYKLSLFPFYASSIYFPLITNETQKNKQRLNLKKDDYMFSIGYFLCSILLGPETMESYYINPISLSIKYEFYINELINRFPNQKETFLSFLNYKQSIQNLIIPKKVSNYPLFIYETMESLFITFSPIVNTTSMLRKALHTMFILSFFNEYKPSDYAFLFPNEETKKMILIASMFMNLIPYNNNTMILSYKELKEFIGNQQDINLFPDDFNISISSNGLMNAILFKEYTKQLDIKNNLLLWIPYILALPLSLLQSFQPNATKEGLEMLGIIQFLFFCIHYGDSIDNCKDKISNLDTNPFFYYYILSFVNGNKELFDEIRADIYELEIITLESTGYELHERKGLRIRIMEELDPCSIVKRPILHIVNDYYGNSFENSFITLFKFVSEHLLSNRGVYIEEWKQLLSIPNTFFIHYKIL